jgi:hypothetical protein
MSRVNEIRKFLEDFSGIYPEDLEIDIHSEMGLVGDDFHEMIEKYSNDYHVDMSNYIWYFHAEDEAGFSFGEFSFDPPYKKVKRIPITPNMLVEFIEKGKWDVRYPKHKLETRRYDLLINSIILIIFIGCLLIWGISKLIN